MASGEVATIQPAELPKGSVITTSGRISGVTEPGEASVHYPFPISRPGHPGRRADLRVAGRGCTVRRLHRRSGRRHRGASTRDPGQGADAEQRSADRRLTGPARDRGGLWLGGPRPGRRVVRAPRRGRRGVGAEGRRTDRRSGQRDSGDQRRHLAGLTLFGFRPPRHRRTDAPAATARYRRGPRAPGGAAPEVAPGRQGTGQRRRCRRR